MRTIALMQPYLFPYTGYFSLIHSCDVFCFLDNVRWIKGGWINRNIVWSGTKTEWFTVPVEKIHLTDRINDVKIADPDFKRKLLERARQIYWDAPNGDLVFDIIDSLGSTEYVVELVENSIAKIAYSVLGLNRTILSSTNIPVESIGEYRVIDISKQLQADRYINMVGGKELYSKETFEFCGLELKFLTPSTPSYRKDNSGNPVPGNLSILDALAYLDIEQVQKMVTDYVLE